MKVTLKFYYRDPSLLSYAIDKHDPNSGQVIPVDVEIAAIPEKGSRLDYGNKKRRVLEVTTLCDVGDGEAAAIILIE